jgi:hypothetical protein
MIEDYSYHGRKHIKRDYYNKTFVNPYFNKKEKLGPKFNTKLYIQILTAIFLIYLIIYSDLFKVRDIEVQGTDFINPQEIRSIVEKDVYRMKLLVFPGRNLIFINKSKIIKEINSKYSLNIVEINKGWQKLTVRVEEKVANLIAFNNSTYYFLDADGGVTKELTAEDLNSYKNKFPNIYINKALNINDKPISGRAVNYILELDKAFIANNIKIKNYEAGEGGEVDQVSALTEAGWRAKFNINTSLSISIENMSLILKKVNQKRLQYIDLRFGDRASYFPEK